MRMSRSTRVLLILLGLGVISLGVVALTYKWSGGTPAILLSVGLVMTVAGAIGSMPTVSLKEGIAWPDPAVYERLDELEKELAIQDKANKLLSAELEQADEAIDYILSRLPAPPDDEDYASDQARLDDWEEALDQTRHEITSRQYSGEDYDDGISLTGLEMMRDDMRRDIRLETRRLKAKKRFGPAHYDGHNPAREI